jgi:hypothetical protein
MEIFHSLGVWKYSQVFSLAAKTITKTISMEIFPWFLNKKNTARSICVSNLGVTGSNPR